MDKKRHGAVVMVLVMVGMVAFAGASFAGWGRGERGDCPGTEGRYGPRGSGCPGWGADLTDEETAAIRNERMAFFEQTRELREAIHQKRTELRAELDKETPNADTASGLQKQISSLRAQMDQQRLDHQLKMKKENPELYGKGMGRGMGPGHGRKGAGRCMGPGSLR
jgi:Spy/CpxP family protein refolding chaperone